MSGEIEKGNVAVALKKSLYQIPEIATVDSFACRAGGTQFDLKVRTSVGMAVQQLLNSVRVTDGAVESGEWMAVMIDTHYEC
ncbi:hypothetical protein CA12_28770 [Alienimonas californiensis]|uniref:Uncharacterized protein n=1 Tax=Alienimonas californiensis TaxID=2527989 RepID=A0A517PBM6_9PLAN|nr:hypothetical protein CA12_28770 [Alienimonas californiensis]